MENNNDAQTICDKLFDDMIGNNNQFDSPITNEKGEPMKKFLIYNDFTASGKGIRQIENLFRTKYYLHMQMFIPQWVIVQK